MPVPVTVILYPTAHTTVPGIPGGQWTNPADAYTDDGVLTTKASLGAAAGNRWTHYKTAAGDNVQDVIPSTATAIEVRAKPKWKTSSASWSATVRGVVGSTQEDSHGHTVTNTTIAETEIDLTADRAWAYADLATGTLGCEVLCAGGPGTTASMDVIPLAVTYTPAGTTFDITYGGRTASVNSHTLQAGGVRATFGSFTSTWSGKQWALGAFALAHAGRTTTANSFDHTAGGRLATANSFDCAAGGTQNVGYERFVSDWAGGLRVDNAFEHLYPGATARYNIFDAAYAGTLDKFLTETFQAQWGGKHHVLRTYAASYGGRVNILTEFSSAFTGATRIANDDKARYELYVTYADNGAALPPINFANPPVAVSTSTTITYPLARPDSGYRTYRRVVRRRNRWGIETLNDNGTLITINADGSVRVVQPSPPTSAAAAVAGAGIVRITAEYLYLADGTDAGNQFLIYFTTDSSTPDPATGTPVVLPVVRADGVAKLSHDLTGLADGTVVKAVVRTRRTGTPSVDSESSDLVTAAATNVGPAAVDATAFAGTAYEQHQGS